MFALDPILKNMQQLRCEIETFVQDSMDIGNPYGNGLLPNFENV